MPSLSQMWAPVWRRSQELVSKVQLAHWLWLGAGAVLALLLLFLMWPRALAVETALIDRGEVRHDVVDEGRTRIHDVFVVAAPVSGELQRLQLEPGDAVERGQIVATILPADPALLDARLSAEANAAVASAQAALAGAAADLTLAQRDQQRATTLHAQGFASQAALDVAEARVRAARAQVSARRADLERARASAGAPGARAHGVTPVPSPTSGRVLRLLQQSETITPAGAPLMEIGDPRQVEVVAEFLSQDAVLMHEGADAFIENWGGPAPIAARVFRIEPFAHTKVSALGVEEQRVNVIVHLLHPENAPPLGHGFRVDVRIILWRADAVLRTPTDALVRDGAGWAVFKLVNGRARLTPVVIGEGDANYRALVRGVQAGDEVILFPGDSLQNDARVRPLRRHSSPSQR